MKNVGYRNAWAFLDGYRGKEFQGKWPGVNEMFHISVLRFPDHLAFHSFEPETKLTFAEAERRIMEIAGYLQSTGFQEGDKASYTQAVLSFPSITPSRTARWSASSPLEASKGSSSIQRGWRESTRTAVSGLSNTR